MTTANRLLSLVLALALVLTCVLFSTPAALAAGGDANTPQGFPNTYINTGNQREDILGVALTQLGYVEGYNNNNKYGASLNINYMGWCGAFVSWCAVQAGIPDSVLVKTGVPSPASFGLSAKYYPAYTPQPGDLFFVPDGSHVGLVYYLDGDYFYTVEGNYSNGVYTSRRRLRDVIFGAPAYAVTAQTLYSGNCGAQGNNVQWALNDRGTLTISGSGAMADFSFATGYAPWYAHNSSIQSVVIANGVTSLGDYAFKDCTALTTVSFPGSLLTLGKYAFQNCSALTGLSLPGGLKTISDGAFFGCTGLTDIGIPASVTTINGYPFTACTALAGIWVEDGNLHFSSDTNGILFNKDKTKLLLAPKALSGSYAVPEGVTTVGYYAFEGCTKLRSVTLPQGLTTIEGCAFEGCSRLGEVALPNSVTTIAHYAFARCTALSSVTIPDGVTTIEHYAFNGCASLSAIALPASVRNLGQGAFDGCSGLTTVTMAANLAVIDQAVFRGCSALSAITIPDSVTAIGADAFSGCSALRTVCIPQRVTEIGRGAFDGCTALTTLTLPAAIRSIGYSAFIDCNRLSTVFYQGTKQAKPGIELDADNAALTAAKWHFETQNATFADQSCLYCTECDNYFLPDGSVALATVTFLNWDGSTIASAQYHYGDPVTAPTLFPRPAGQAFAGWDKPVVACAGNATYTAQFQKIESDGTGSTGDTNGDSKLDNDDVVYLLWHLLFGDEYPMDVSGDFTGDNRLNNDDVVYLLWHLLFGDEYPLS